jgi:hypothetical protein
MSVTRHRLAADAVLQIMWQADSRREKVMTTAVSDDSTVQDRVIVLTSAEDSAGEVFRFEYVARQVTPPPRDHIHKSRRSCWRCSKARCDAEWRASITFCNAAKG